MLGSKKKLLFCLLLTLLSVVTQDAFAWRFGLNTGLYNESIMTGAFQSREIGLRLGFYADRTFNDILYASARNGGNLGGFGGGAPAPCPNNACGQMAFAPPPPPPMPCCDQMAYAPPPPPSCCGSSMQAFAPVGCGSSPYGMPQMQMPPVGCGASPYGGMPMANNSGMGGKTEIYLVMMPSQPAQQQQMQYPPQQPPQGYYPPQPNYQQMPPQGPPPGYYRDTNVDYNQPVRGMW